MSISLTAKFQLLTEKQVALITPVDGKNVVKFSVVGEIMVIKLADGLTLDREVPKGLSLVNGSTGTVVVDHEGVVVSIDITEPPVKTKTGKSGNAFASKRGLLG